MDDAVRLTNRLVALDVEGKREKLHAANTAYGVALRALIAAEREAGEIMAKLMERNP